jgi:hypothetical protein
MANRRLPVRKIKEILRLKHACGLSKREIEVVPEIWTGG